MQRSMRSFIAVLAIVAMIATGCGATGDEQGGGDEGDATTTTASGSGDGDAAGGASEADFGSIKAPCGKGEAKVKADEAGKGADKLYIGVGNDRTSTIRSGLLAELWDAGVGFAKWCNAQGGIGGLEIELVDLDSELLSVEPAMTVACTDVFAMVGGGMTQDDLQFSGKEGSDFHKCKLIDIPAFAVSPAKTDSNGQVQPVPNPAYSMNTTWTLDYRKLHPEAKDVTVVWGDLPSLRVVAERQKTAIAAAGLNLAGEVKYNPLETDFLPVAQQVIDSKADTVTYVGEPENLSKLAKELGDQSWKGRFLLETNLYDPKTFASGPDVIDGSLLRSYFHPFEEADRWPAVKKYMDITKAANPDAKIALLGLQATSGWLLFATAANACMKQNGGEISRQCILEQAAAEDEWTGGGIHAPMDPGKAESSKCGMLLGAEGGTFARVYPELGGEGDDGDGFHCPDDGVAKVTVDVGKGNVDPSRPVIDG